MTYRAISVPCQPESRSIQSVTSNVQVLVLSPWPSVEHVWNVMPHAQKPDLVFPLNGRVHLNWRRASVQSTTGSRGVRISGSNAGYTMFRGRVQDYWLPTPLACFPFTSPTVRYRVPSGFNWALLTDGMTQKVHCNKPVCRNNIGHMRFVFSYEVEVMGDWRKIRNPKLRDLYSSINIKVTKSRRMR